VAAKIVKLHQADCKQLNFFAQMVLMDGYLCSMKRSIVQSVLEMRCPRCRDGEMFTTSSFGFHKPFDMEDKCDHCGQDFRPEPGFYYGAMFLSYIMTGWFCLAVVAVVHWVFKIALIPSFIILIAITGVLFVWFFRISRSIWIHINVKYIEASSVKKDDHLPL
jgi:uncharacterized protein (DUF983 family)